jgi:hypothetical protein
MITRKIYLVGWYDHGILKAMKNNEGYCACISKAQANRMIKQFKGEYPRTKFGIHEAIGEWTDEPEEDNAEWRKIAYS